MARKKKSNYEKTAITIVITIMTTLFSMGLYFFIRENIFRGDAMTMLLVSGIGLGIAMGLGFARWSQIEKKL